MADKFSMSDYVDVAERIATFHETYPEGSLEPADPYEPFRMVDAGDKTFCVYTAAAYRTPDDKRPGIGVAWEPVPGRTPYTRDSELMNAETSAWGRAIVALGIPTKRIASANEVRNRQADREAPRQTASDVEFAELVALGDQRGITPELIAKSLDKRTYAQVKARLLKHPVIEVSDEEPTPQHTAETAPSEANAASRAAAATPTPIRGSNAGNGDDAA